MIITNRFVFIHHPKTGGNFVHKVLGEIYPERKLSVLIGNASEKIIKKRSYIRLITKIQGYQECLPKHGTCNEIPQSERGKPIVSIVRNPYDRYVSQYFFRWWATHPWDMLADLDKVIELYPRFPEVSFEEFVTICNTQVKEHILRDSSIPPQENSLGYCSTDFVRFYFRNPELVYPIIDDAYIEAQKYTDDMFDVRFLRTHLLNQDLYDYLVSLGYPRSKVEFILRLDKVRPYAEERQRPHDDWQRYYAPELKSLVRSKENLVFSIFPEFDV